MLNRTLLNFVPRRTRLNLAALVAFGLFLLLNCCRYHQSASSSTHRQRQLRWYNYDDSNDDPNHAPRIIIPAAPKNLTTPRTTTQPPGEEQNANPPLPKDSLYIDAEWAEPNHDFTAESKRFLELIQHTSPDTNICPGRSVFDQFVCCLTEELSSGVIYSFNLDQSADVTFERALLRKTGAERVFIFNPNYDPAKVKTEFTQKVKRDVSGLIEPEQFDSESEELAKFNFYKIALDTQSSQNPNRRWRRKTFTEIRSEVGHEKIDLMRINMKSSEWKVLRHWLETGEMARIDQLLVKIHLHWSGFGVSGDDAEIVHQWYNTISSMISSGLKLVSSEPILDGPKTFLGKNQFDTHCCFYLTFFRE